MTPLSVTFSPHCTLLITLNSSCKDSSLAQSVNLPFPITISDKGECEFVRSSASRPPIIGFIAIAMAKHGWTDWLSAIIMHPFKVAINGYDCLNWTHLPRVLCRFQLAQVPTATSAARSGAVNWSAGASPVAIYSWCVLLLRHCSLCL